MKQQPCGLNNYLYNNTLIRCKLFNTAYSPTILTMVTGMLFLYACENDIEKINTITKPDVLPEISGKNFEIIYSDSALVKVRILAPEIKKFSNNKEPYIVFPRGMTAYFYDNNLTIKSVIKANYVIFYEKEYLWEAKNNVEARNLIEGDQLNTEHLFWDERKRIIYSSTHSRIVNKDGTFYGDNGFEANQDLSRWKLKGSKGTVKVRDE